MPFRGTVEPSPGQKVQRLKKDNKKENLKITLKYVYSPFNPILIGLILSDVDGGGGHSIPYNFALRIEIVECDIIVSCLTLQGLLIKKI